MIDYLSLEYEGDIEPLENHPLINYKIIVCEESGEIVSKFKFGSFRNFEIRIYDSGRTYIKGSIHCFDMPTYGNSKPFTFQRLCHAILVKIPSELFIDPQKCLIHNIEFGVNVDTPIQLYTTRLIKGLLVYKGLRFKDVWRSSNSSNKMVELSHYTVKCYDKSVQYNSSNNLIRFELHYNRMSTINELGVVFLTDLVKTEMLIKLRNRLVEVWDKIIYCDPHVFDKNNIDQWREWHSQEYWVKLVKSTPRTNRNKVSREIAKMRSEMNALGSHAQDEFSELIVSTWDDCLLQ